MANLDEIKKASLPTVARNNLVIRWVTIPAIVGLLLSSIIGSCSKSADGASDTDGSEDGGEDLVAEIFRSKTEDYALNPTNSTPVRVETYCLPVRLDGTAPYLRRFIRPDGLPHVDHNDETANPRGWRYVAGGIETVPIRYDKVLAVEMLPAKKPAVVTVTTAYKY